MVFWFSMWCFHKPKLTTYYSSLLFLPDTKLSVWNRRQRVLWNVRRSRMRLRRREPARSSLNSRPTALRWSLLDKQRQRHSPVQRLPRLREKQPSNRPS